MAIINPKAVCDVGKALSKLAKTDKLDAQALALFIQRIQSPVQPLKDIE